MTTVLYLLLAVAVINVAVFIHEYGHLQSARKHGIQINEFSIGFGKIINSWETKKGLKVNLKLIPAGGSVSPAGMTVEEVKEMGIAKEKSYIYASPINRLKVTFAGIGYNILFAMLTQLLIIPLIIKPNSVEEWIGIPGTVFWSTLAIIGAFISIIISAPINGFDNVNSIIKLPSGLEESVNTAETQEISVFATILMAIMALNLFMAIFNFLPIYPLDGFFLATAVIDWTRVNIHEEKYQPLSHHAMRFWVIAGYSLTIALWLFLLARDILQII